MSNRLLKRYNLNANANHAANHADMAVSNRPIHLYFRGQIIQVMPTHTTQTVLQFLRESCRATGTKEGCAEGDCGACTVVIGKLDKDYQLQLHAVNACIGFLPTLDGCALFTIEDLETLGDGLHPIQQAMIDAHGSQCGFCTPGIIMSLWAMYENSATCPNDEQILDGLSGNLCRCTGYRPIIDAMKLAYTLPQVTLAKDNISEQLQSLSTLPSLNLQVKGQYFFIPKTVDELAQLYIEHPNALLLAGSTDIGLWVTKQHRKLDNLIFLNAIAQLNTIVQQADYLQIGAAVSLKDAFVALSAQDSGWQELARRFASKQIKNAGTLGGNIANGSPIGDSMPALLAQSAKLVLRRGTQTRTIDLDEFYLAYQQTALQPGEFITAILVPNIQTMADSSYFFATYKVAKRFDADISAVCGAYFVQLDNQNIVMNIRIAYGGMAAIPKRANLLETALLGQSWDETTLDKVLPILSQDFTPLSDGRASQGYRMQIAKNLVTRFFYETQHKNVVKEGDATRHQIRLTEII